MCYEIDYEIFAAQKKAQEARIKQTGVIDQLLNEANKQGGRDPGPRGHTREIADVPTAPLRRGFLLRNRSDSHDVGANAP
jgi:hypothetical protein